MNQGSPYVPVIEIEPVDIAAYRAGNTGIDYVHGFDSGRPGPHVMINALTHGNEVCGAHTLAALLRRGVRPKRGRLTFGFANVSAYERFDPLKPFESRFVDDDFNRLWTADVLDGPRESVELARARALRPLYDTVDHLLDLHSTALPQAPMLLCGMQDKGLALARAIGAPVHVVIDAGHANGRRLRDYAGFDDPASPRSAMLVECGQHFERGAAAVAMETSLRFLRHLDVVDDDVTAEVEGVATERQMVIRVTEAVTINSERFAFTREYAGFEVIPKAGTLIGRDGDDDVRTPCDDCVMVMPGRDLKQGLTAVRLGQIVD